MIEIAIPALALALYTAAAWRVQRRRGTVAKARAVSFGVGAALLLRRNLLVYGAGGLVVPFLGIKVIDMLLVLFRWT